MGEVILVVEVDEVVEVVADVKVVAVEEEMVADVVAEVEMVEEPI